MGSGSSVLVQKKIQLKYPNTRFNQGNRIMNQKQKQSLDIQPQDYQILKQNLQKHCLFCWFPEQKINIILPFFKKWKYCGGTYIYRQYDQSNTLYVIRQGCMSVQIDCNQVKFYNDSQYFGQDSLCFQSVRSESICVYSKKAIIYQLQKSNFFYILKQQMKKYIDHITNIFNKIHFFNFLTHKQKNFLIQHTNLFRFKKSQNLFQKQQIANSFFIVIKGTVTIQIDRKKSILMQEGDYFGQTAFLCLVNNSQKNQRMGKASAATQGMQVYAIGLAPVKNCLGNYIRSIVFFNQQKWALYRDEILSHIPRVNYNNLIKLFKVRQGKKYSVLAKRNTKPKYIFIPLQVQINKNKDLKLYCSEFILPQNKDNSLTYDIILTDTGYYAYAYIDEVKQVLGLSQKQNSRTSCLANQPLYLVMTLNLNNISQYSKRLASSQYSTILIVQDMKFGNQFIVKAYKKYKQSNSLVEQTSQNQETKFKNKNIFSFKSMSSYLSSSSSLQKTIIAIPKQNIYRQRYIVSKLCNRFICGYYKSQQDENNYYLFLEFIAGVDLYEILKIFGRIPILIIRYILASIACALQYLHSINVIYRNLNCKDIIYKKNGQIVIVDLSCAKILDQTHKTKTLIGVPHYMAPEVIKQEEYTYNVDVWSMGVILYELSTSFVPFGRNSTDPMQIYNSILNDNLDLSLVKNKNAAILIQKLLEKNPQTRLQKPLLIRNFKFMSDQEFEWKIFLQQKMQSVYYPQDLSYEFKNINNDVIFDPAKITQWNQQQ